MYVMFVAADSLYRNSTNAIGWSYIMCPLESLIINHYLINRFFDKLSYLNNRPQLNIIKMTNENESVYIKWPFFFVCHTDKMVILAYKCIQEPNITWDHVNLGLCKDNLYMIYLRCPFTQPVKKIQTDMFLLHCFW